MLREDFLRGHLILGDSSKVKKDSLKVHEPSPSRAALFSTILPGAGQVYNKKYWKAPIVYAGLGTIGFFAYQNHKQYLIFRDALRARYDQDPATVDNQFPNISNEVLKAQREYYRRNRDFMYIIGGVVYLLNILDAYVDAHLKAFTVSDKLTVFVLPSPNAFIGSISFRW